MKYLRSPLGIAVALAVTGFAGGAHAEYLGIEEVTIIGSAEAAREVAGSGSVIDSEQMRIEVATDINQLLKTVPGVYIREEDGFGLRPNIGIRGATSERSSKITLLEDGILMAPAPYAAPAAYYFPTTARMHAIEVLKGASLLRYGPQTTGGVVNMVSTPLPNETSGRIRASYGQDAQADLLASFGGRVGEFSGLIETTQRSGDGFKRIDRSSQTTGYDIEDYLVKLGWERGGQSLVFTGQYSDEVSDETYLGLTDADFGRNEDRRYGMSVMDQMDNDHTGLRLSYRNELSEQVVFTAAAYRNEFNRDWFKLDGVGGLIRAANAGDVEAQGILDGSIDASGLRMKHNNRSYVSKGIQANVDWTLGDHQLAFGGRVHDDTVDRFQPVETFDQINGEMIYTGTIQPTGGDNRIEGADARALWVTDQWQVSERLRVDLALRYEDVDSYSRRYADVERTTVQRVAENEASEWLPGVAMQYELSEQVALIAGVHKGFSPLGAGAGPREEPETSINWEAGFRYEGDVFVEAIGFYSDFSDKAENCSNANPCSNGQTSGSFTTGEAVIAGVEFQLGKTFELASATLPVSLMYTFTQAEISADNAVAGVVDGDELAAVPENTLSLRVGYETSMGWDNYAVVKYTDSFCSTVGCNRTGEAFNLTDDLLVVDLISRYRVNDDLIAFAKIDNAFDERAIVSRQPDGARPNKPFTASVGVEWSF